MPKNAITRSLCTGLLGLGLALTQVSTAADIRLPDLGGTAQAVLPRHEARQYGQRMLRRMRDMHMVVDDPLINSYINDVGYRLVANSADPTLRFTFFVVKSQVINAFAAPGGFIGINSGLIALTQSEAELAAVMAHEIGHITQHHLQRAFEAAKKDAPLAALIMLGAMAAGAAAGGGGSQGNAAVGVMTAGMGLLQQRRINFTRKDEIEADRAGIQTLAAAGYDPEAMASFFHRMQETRGVGSDVPELLRTHPVTRDRIADAKALARSLEKEDTKPHVPPIDSQQWNKITAPLPYVSSPVQFSRSHARTGDNLLYLLMRERVRALALEPGASIKYYNDHKQAKPLVADAQHYGHAVALLRNHQAARAVTILEPLAKRHAGSMPIDLALATAQAQAGQSAKAEALFNRLHSKMPRNKAVTLFWARALLLDKNPKQAKRAMKLLDPLMQDTQDPQMFTTFARASEIAGDKFNAAEAWANVSYLEGRPFDAMEQLQRLLKDKDLNYYQRSRLQADIDQLHPILLELKKRHIPTADRH